MRHHMMAAYRQSLVEVVRVQGTDKGLQHGAAAVERLLQTSEIVKVTAWTTAQSAQVCGIC